MSNDNKQGAELNQQQNNIGENMESEVKSTLVSRNITVFGKRTSIRLEPEMWSSLKEIADREGCSIHDVCTLVGMRKKENTSLTAAIRVFIVLYFRAGCTEEGHRRVGHGDFEIMKRRARIPEELMGYFEGRRRVASMARRVQGSSLLPHNHDGRVSESSGPMYRAMQ